MQIKEVLQKTTEHFKNKGIHPARLEAETLLSSALNWKRIDLYLKHEYPMTESELQKCREWVRRRSLGEPTAYICGTKGFYKKDFLVSPDVLIPRPETELIVEKAISVAQALEVPIKIVDFGAGSGCIGLSILSEIQGASLVGIDVSPRATEVAKTNAKNLGLESRSEFQVLDLNSDEGDRLANLLSNTVHLVVANPPYISSSDPVEETVRKFEPHQALFSADEGMLHFKKWTLLAVRMLRTQGRAYFEIGFNQGDRARDFMQQQVSMADIKIHKDYAGLDRVAEFTKN